MDRDISSLKPDISPKEPLKSNEWLLWCRLCATNTFANCIDMYNNNMEPIHVGKNPANAITRIIEQYFAVKITHQDSLPKVLCKSCFNLMVSMNDFSERVMDVQKMFYELKYNYSNVSLVVKSRYSKDDEINSQKIITQPALTDVCMYRYANIRRSQKNSHTGGDCDNPFAKKETITNNIMQCKADVTSVELLEEDIFVDEDGNFIDNSKKEDDPFGSLEESANHANKWILKRAITSKKTYSKNDPSKDANTVLKRKWKVFRGRNEICKKNIKLISDKLDEFQIDIPCRECNEQCKSFQVYFEHLISVHACDATTTKIWKCPLCHKLLSSVHRLEQHLKTHIPREIKMLPCSECDMQFPTNGRLNAHIKIKHNSKLYMCDECGLSLSTKSNLKFHMLTHTDVAPLECEICKKRFKYARRLKIHMETHDDQKHICNVCGLQLNTRVTLRGHMLVHNDIMKYKCDSCGRAFRHKKTLKFHLISHTGLKPYTCDYCDRAFTNGANCRLHKQKIHPDEWAALKASGCIKTIVQRLPNIETLKTLTRSTGNVNPPHVSPKQKQGAYKQTADEIVGKNVVTEKLAIIK